MVSTDQISDLFDHYHPREDFLDHFEFLHCFFFFFLFIYFIDIHETDAVYI